MARSRRGRILAEKIEENARHVEAWLPGTLEGFQTDALRQNAVERALQVSIEALVDLAALVWTARRLGVPKDEEGIVLALRNASLLTSDEATTLADLRRFRNVLVHQYERLDVTRVYAHAKEAPRAMRPLRDKLLAALEATDA